MKFPFVAISLAFPFALFSHPSASVAARFYELGSIEGRSYSEPTGISAGGRVVVGYADDNEGMGHPFRQVRLGRLEAIPVTTSFYGIGVSADGSVVVANSDSPGGYNRAFLWSRKTDVVYLSTDPNLSFSAVGVSGNGAVVFGYLQDLANFEPGFMPDQPCLWSAKAGFQLLDNPLLESSYPSAASYHGDVIVSGIPSGTGNFHACRWLRGGPVELLPDFGTESYAYGLSADGRIAAGYSRGSDNVYRAVRWDDDSGMQLLDGNSAATASFALSVSADGSRIVGNFALAPNFESAFLWTAADGLRSLDQMFKAALPRGWRFVTAAAISSDGRWIVGTAYSSRKGLRGYILDTGRGHSRLDK